jgi:hypothetical protein
MRDDFAVAIAGKVVIQHHDRFARIEFSMTIEVAQQFLFLRVDANDWPPRL